MYTHMEFSPSDVGFSHPLSAELVTQASRYIRDDLMAVMREHDDSETRKVDKRRVHTPLSESSWIIAFKHNKVLITNQISGSSSKQFDALYNGNGPAKICARHTTRPRLKGWSNDDRHRSVILGGRKPVPGTLGLERPGMLKYYDKREGIWMYRQCVRPISPAIIKDVNRSIRRAVFTGLERARYEMYDRYDKDTEGSNEPEDAGMSDEFTLEEMHHWTESTTKVDKDIEEYKIKKYEEEQVTMDSQVDNRLLQYRARSEMQKVGLENKQPKGKPETKSWFGKIVERVEKTTEDVADRIHRYFLGG